MQVRSLGQEDALEEGMATHSSILSWRISCTEEPGRLQSMGLQRDSTEATQHAHMADSLCCIAETNTTVKKLKDTYSLEGKL